MIITEVGEPKSKLASVQVLRAKLDATNCISVSPLDLADYEAGRLRVIFKSFARDISVVCDDFEKLTSHHPRDVVAPSLATMDLLLFRQKKASCEGIDFYNLSLARYRVAADHGLELMEAQLRKESFCRLGLIKGAALRLKELGEAIKIAPQVLNF